MNTENLYNLSALQEHGHRIKNGDQYNLSALQRHGNRIKSRVKQAMNKENSIIF